MAFPTGSCLFCACLFASLLPTLVSAITREEIREEVRKYEADVLKIAEYLTTGEGRHQTFDRLALLGDEFGHRVTGSQVLEEVIDYVIQNLTAEGFDVHGENVTVPKWVRGTETAEMISPRYQWLPILGLGSSVGTNESLEAEIVVVKSFDELHELNPSDVKGKIVVYNAAWAGSYGDTVMYRRDGAVEAAKMGGVAALVHSVTQYSIASPHTGQQTYNESIEKIPVAAITIEDAEMLQRMYDRGDSITIRLFMNDTNEEDDLSLNIVAELKGTEFPNETVIFGGHIDTWDVGHGSMDDGGGVMISWQALSAIKALGLQPRRTMRVVLWTAEEQGLIGGEAYYEAHKGENQSISLIMESDHGAFKPRGVGFSGSDLALAYMEEIMSMLEEYNTTEVEKGAGSSSDTGWWVDGGVPGVELFSYNEDYFFYHHTHGDHMTVLNADDLDLCTVVWATAAYVVANLDEKLPREGDYPPPEISGAVNYPSSFSLTLLVSLLVMTAILKLSKS